MSRPLRFVYCLSLLQSPRQPRQDSRRPPCPASCAGRSGILALEAASAGGNMRPRLLIVFLVLLVSCVIPCLGQIVGPEPPGSGPSISNHGYPRRRDCAGLDHRAAARRRSGDPRFKRGADCNIKHEPRGKVHVCGRAHRRDMAFRLRWTATRDMTRPLRFL